MLHNSEFPWPKKTDVAFGCGPREIVDDRNIAYIDWIRSDLGTHADAFQAAGDLIVDSLADGKYGKGHSHADAFFFPVAYLYRHAIELSLKEAIGYAIRLGLLQRDESLSAALSEHKLYVLWNKLKPALESFWPEANRDPLQAAERIISQYHEKDKSGQAFRYPTTKTGRPSLSKNGQSLKMVDLAQLKKVTANLCSFLGGCTSAFSAALDDMPSEDW